jgi:hypothetical protein
MAREGRNGREVRDGGCYTYHEALSPSFGRHGGHLVRKSAIGGRDGSLDGVVRCSVRVAVM